MAKQEVRRGRKFVEYHDPDTQDEHTFTQEISGADVSYQDEGGAWQQLVEDWETDGQDGFTFRASRMNHKVRFDSIGAWRWYPRRNVETEYLVLNRPQCWLTATKRWGNLLVNGISREGKTITLTSVRNVTRVIHSRWNGIKTDWILEDASAPTRFRQKFDLVGITEIAGVLFGADGERLGELTPTTATDANGAELVCSGSYSGGYVEFQADVTGAVYPVTIDPDFSTGASEDTTLRSSYPTRSYGGIITFSYTPNLIRFDCSSIPATAEASAAQMHFTKSTGVGVATTEVYNFYSIASGNSDWVAGGNQFPATNGQSTWGYKRCYNNAETNVAWAGSDGLGTSGTDYETTLLASFTGSRADDQYTQYTCNFNSSGLTRINGWFGATNTNYGLMFALTSTIRLQTNDDATESYRPVLSVTYTTAGGALLRVNMNAQMQNLSGGLN